jgi:hypothetical protein
MRERWIRRVIRWIGGETLELAVLTPACRIHPGCYMLDGHGGPPRRKNGLAFSTNKAKERRARKETQAQSQVTINGN